MGNESEATKFCCPSQGMSSLRCEPSITGCVSISTVGSLVGIPIKSIIRKKKKKHDEIVLLAKSKL